MVVRVVEARYNCPSACVDALRVRVAEREDLRRTANGDDAVTTDRHGLGPRSARIGREDASVDITMSAVAFDLP